MSTAAPSLHYCDTSLSTPPASRAAHGRRLPHPPQDIHHWRPQQTPHDVHFLKRSLNASSQYTRPSGPRLTCRLTTTATTKIWQGIKGILAHQSKKWSFRCCWKFIAKRSQDVWRRLGSTRPRCLLLSQSGFFGQLSELVTSYWARQTDKYANLWYLTSF